MQRRDVLKLLGSATALSAFPLEALAFLDNASAQVVQSTGLKTLNPHQDATVTTIAELIIPATDTPGAKDARVNEFIDLLLSEWYEAAETNAFLAGLADVDARSKKQFSAAFVDCTAAQQTDLLTQLDNEAMALVTQQKQAELAHTEPPSMSFFYQMKKLTLAGYYTSKIGFTQELGKPALSMGLTGCAPIEESR